MVSIAISFLVIIIALAVSDGFRRELRRGIADLTGDVRISQPGMDIYSEDDPLDFARVSEIVSGLDGIREIVPAVYRAGIVKYDTNIHGVMLKGIPGGGDSLGVSIPSRLSDLLGIGVGDDLLTYFVGERVKVRRFHVASVYQSVLSGNSDLVIYASLADMQRLNGWSEDEVSAVEVKLVSGSDSRAEEMTEDIGTALVMGWPNDESSPVAMSSRTLYSKIFAWLDLIDFNVVIILILMIIVAGFNMISGLLILLFRSISTIGTLKSMGMTDRGISEVFLRVASRIVLKGMAIGNGLAFLFCIVQGTTKLIRLNPESYFLSYVPVWVNLWKVAVADCSAYLAIMLLLLVTSLFVSGVDPAKTVRAQ